MNPHHRTTGTAQEAGSLNPGEPAFLAVGKLRRPHGVHGEILMEVWTDFPERLRPGSVLYVGPDRLPLQIRTCRWHGKHLLVSFEGYTDRDTVGVLRNLWVLVPTADRQPLPEGEYYHHELIGLRVLTDEGRDLGVLIAILETGANDVYVVETQEGLEVLLPAIDDVILSVDLERKEMRVHLLPGLLPS